ncbi:response regulator transcription factor [Herbaspirillum sp. GCM10030257]|uniref:response regulator transcription factor n=1 Tax=Herbaspirillum sp. GCM10030257 TaxID=3273393 RepID=UPI003622F81B
MNIACYIRNNAVFEQVQTVLVRTGFVCERFTSDTVLLRTVRRRDFNFILVDVGIDIKDGESVFSWLTCRSGDNTPVMVLSAVQNADWVAEALNAGADDFLIRPFEPVELVARIHAILRRSSTRPARRIIELAGFALDRDTSTFSYRGTPIELTPREFTMAWLFFSSPGVYVSRETIGTAIWGVDSEIAGRTIEQHVYKLRKKLQFGQECSAMIRTAYSQGYRLELHEQEPVREV